VIGSGLTATAPRPFTLAVGIGGPPIPPNGININDLTPEQRRDLGLRLPRQQKFNKEDVRRWALKTLALLAALSQDERARVLEHAKRVNSI